ncbi:MAG: hypothetical protein FWD71_11650 [Oscillospiraceae bacterium]|nr:hypothetical protein [Oscillospiraceae bacterium]
MKTLKQIISVILLLAFLMSTVFNILFLFNKIGEVMLQVGLVILILVAFLISVLGIIIKKIKKDDRVRINVITPAQELGILYTGMLIIWAVTYFIAVIFK